MRALITGGAGFIGSSLARHWIGTLGHPALIIDKLTYAGHVSSLAEVAKAPGFGFVAADICDRTAMDAAFATCQPDVVFHLAAESHVDRSITGAGVFVQTNLVGTFTMLEAARAHWSGLDPAAKARFRFVHVSTDEVYGSLGPSGLFQETTPYDPRSPYAASKAGADHLAAAWFHTYGLPVVTTNCSNNYGPYHLPEKLIPLVILNALHGHSLPVYGDGSNIRDWLFVDDHARALVLAATAGQPGRTYNVGGRNERTNLEVVEAVCDMLDRLAPKPVSHRALITFVPDRPGHDQRYAIDASRIRRELGWSAAESFETGLEKTVRWYLQREDWWRPLWAQGVGASRLGLPTGRPETAQG